MTKNSAPISERLRDHCVRLSEDIVADYQDALHSGTPEAVAAYRETFIQEIVGRFFPRTFRVAKGSVFDSFGRRSNSIDCVVCAANHPLLLDPVGRVTTLLADGVQCGIEIKPDIRDQPSDFGRSRQGAPEIIRGLEQLRTVKRLRRRESALLGIRKDSAEMQDYAHRVPSYLFSVVPTNIAQLCKYVADYYVKNRVPLEEQLDMIVVLHNGVIVNTKYPEKGITQTIAPPHSWMSGMAAFATGDDALAQFLLFATCDLGPEPTFNTPVFGHYFNPNVMPESWRMPVVACSNVPSQNSTGPVAELSMLLLAAGSAMAAVLAGKDETPR